MHLQKEQTLLGLRKTSEGEDELDVGDVKVKSSRLLLQLEATAGIQMERQSRRSDKTLRAKQGARGALGSSKTKGGNEPSIVISSSLNQIVAESEPVVPEMEKRQAYEKTTRLSLLDQS